ncbi:uncharacterized protein [Amphiura filiformis]|uniref:uncharacterized protein n=1 Tax=Amphiura filiformis TaxID=82378 RepID=UPI003B21350A
MPVNRYHGDGYQTGYFNSGRELCDAVKRGDVKFKIGDRLQMELWDDSIKYKIYSHWAIVSTVSEDPYECRFLEFSVGSAANSYILGSTFTMPSSSNLAQSPNALSNSNPPNASNTSNPSDSVSALYSTAIVKIADFPRPIKINNSKDSQARVLPTTEIRRRIDAVQVVPDLMEPHDVVTNNCEHFVNYIRYNRRESMQVVGSALIVFAATAGPILVRNMCVIA